MKYVIIFYFRYELQITKYIRKRNKGKYFRAASLSGIVFLKNLFLPKKVTIFIKNQYGKAMGHIFHNTEHLI